MIRPEAENLLLEFGLCPDYSVMQVEGEWVEYYEPPSPEDINVAFHAAIYKPNEPLSVKRTRLHLNTHTVELTTGVILSANFAVSHTTKMIWLQVTPMGEFGRMTQYDK